MKYLTLFIAALLLFGCNIEDDPEYRKMKGERDSLINTDSLKNISIIDFVQSFNDIQENLDQIKEKENIISLQTANNIEDNIDAADQINDDVKHIYELMLNNKDEIERLKRKLRGSNQKNVELERMMTRLIKQLEDKDADIIVLKNKLEKMDLIIEDLAAAIDTLALENEGQQEVIEEQNKELTTAFYVVGYSKELKEQQVITKEGGFIGLGRIEKLRQNFEKDYFTEINIEQDTVIDIMTKKAKIITNHPAGSYSLVGADQVERLEIANAKEFWSVSKYLVIIVD